MSKDRLSSRQINTLKHLAITCADGGMVTLTRDQREAMQPLWRKGVVEMWFRCVPEEDNKGSPFFRPSRTGWYLIRAVTGVGRSEQRSAA